MVVEAGIPLGVRCAVYEERFYRRWVWRDDLERFEVKVRESDLLILCDQPLREPAAENLASVRRTLEAYLTTHPHFGHSLCPVKVEPEAPAVVQVMAASAERWAVGPMAAVAGAVAECVGRCLLELGAETVMVENGGDVFVHAREPVRFALYAGEDSPFSNKVGFVVSAGAGLGVCTSSGRVGPSLSFGRADAVVALARDAAEADAAATAIANHIQGPQDVDRVVAEQQEKQGLTGLVACAGDRLGVWGDLELIKL